MSVSVPQVSGFPANLSLVRSGLAEASARLAAIQTRSRLHSNLTHLIHQVGRGGQGGVLPHLLLRPHLLPPQVRNHGSFF